MKLLFLGLVAVALVRGTPYFPAPPKRDESLGSPCAQVAQSSAAAILDNIFAQPTVSAKLAYDCLTSVPLHKQEATDLINSIIPYVEWQSDISYLKNPPKGYLMPAVDIWKKFKNILSNIDSGVYPNEHAFQADLLASFNAVHDGHFRFAPDLLSKVISFSRPVSLVSVSKDGNELPKIYAKDDILAFKNKEISKLANGRSLPSEVLKINGEHAVTYLNNLAQLGTLQDPDALYNNMFFEKAINALAGGSYGGYFAGNGRFRFIYPGPNTTLEFANRTINVYENQATVFGDFDGVTDGETLYQKFCSVNSMEQKRSTKTYPSPSPAPPASVDASVGFPLPVVISGDQQVSGYFLDDRDPKYADVAVLSMLSFAPNYPIEFQSVVETFISQARAAGKTKLVIDLSGNGGGTILVGYDTFRQLFPSITQDGFTRFREHEAFNILSEQISLISTTFDATTADNEQIFAYLTPPNYRYDLNETNQHFLTHKDKFAPREFNGDKFTANMRWNLDEPLTTTNTTWGVGETITGYGDRQNFTQPFEAVDIVMIYDGYCASTCSLFSEFMRLQGGVKSIAYGGLPHKRPIQAVGGTKGANNYPYNFIMTLASVPLYNATPSQLANWTSLRAYTNLAQSRSTDNSLNVRDQILRPNLDDGIPAQFIYEEADCRVFWEPEMITDMKAIWKRAADVAWGGSKCVAGRGFGAHESLTVRHKKSQELKVNSKRDIRIPFDEAWLKSIAWSTKPDSPIHGQKVPL